MRVVLVKIFFSFFVCFLALDSQPLCHVTVVLALVDQQQTNGDERYLYLTKRCLVFVNFIERFNPKDTTLTKQGNNYRWGVTSYI